MLILRGEKGEKLTIDDLDSNFQYLEELAMSGGSGITEEVIEFEFLDINLIESELADFTQPLTKSMTFSFSGFKDETETIRGPLYGFNQVKSVKKTYLGLVDSDFLFQTYFGGTFDAPQEFKDLLFNGKLILEFTQNDFYVVQEPGDELTLFSKSFNYTIKKSIIANGPRPLIEAQTSYGYGVDGGEYHQIKITEKGIQSGFLDQDFSDTMKIEIDNTGAITEVPLRMNLSNLPDLANVNQDQLYIDENGFIKINIPL